jgi:hypothetical protein
MFAPYLQCMDNVRSIRDETSYPVSRRAGEIFV